MQMQQAEASGTGNVIVQIGGDGNTVIAGTPHLTLTRPGRIARTVRSDPDTGKPHQIDVIRAETRSVEVVGRKAELASLTEWLHSTAAVSVRVMVGDAGVGKSRLALELIETVARAGWRAGFPYPQRAAAVSRTTESRGLGMGQAGVGGGGLCSCQRQLPA